MICPSCQCEYLLGVTQCADCGVPLVDALDSSTKAPQPDGSIASIWSGNDPREFAAVKAALEKAEIPYMGPPSTSYFIFPSMRSKMEVCVYSADRDRAERVVFELEGWDDPDELTPEERESLALPESDAADNDKATNVVADVPEDWDDQEPMSEVWKGDGEDFANTLMACFRENGIPSRKAADQNGWRLVVRSEQEVRAREIVREVIEASPPE